MKNILIVAFFTFSFSGCSRPQSDQAKVYLTLPKSINKSDQASTLQSLNTSSGKNWGVPDPASIDEINCYAVFIGGDASELKGSSCKNTDETKNIEFGKQIGLYAPGEAISIELPIGLKRNFYVLGLKSSSGLCQKVNNANEIDQSLYSNPFMIGTTTADLVAGSNTIEIQVSLDSTFKIGDCSFFNKNPSPNPGGNGSVSYGTGADGDLILNAPSTYILSNQSNASGTKLTSTSRVKGLSIITSETVQFTIEDRWDTSNIKVNDEVMFYIAAGSQCGSLYPGYKISGLVTGLDFDNRRIIVQTGDETLLSSLTNALLAETADKGNSFCRAVLTRIPNFNSISVSANASIYPSDQGFGSLYPHLISSAPALYAGSHHTCVRHTNNQLKCWGDNSYNQLSLGTDTNQAFTPPNYFSKTDSSGVNMIAFGYGYSCTIDLIGGLKCWGYGALGQLGYGDTNNQFVYPATPISGITSPSFVAAGHSHTCAIDSGSVKCWGNGSFGQIGNGTTTNQTAPVSISVGGTPYRLALGNSFSCAHLTGSPHYVKCWGHNFYGQIGDGTTINRTSAVTTASEAGGVVLLKTGYAHACYTHDADQLKCWGKNDYGQVGNGTTTQVNSPVSISTGLGNNIFLALGDDFTCAANTTTVKCWGNNNFGQLGQGDTTNRPNPTNVNIPSGTISSMAAGAHHICVQYSDERIYCWGSNGSGAIGLGVSSISAYGDNAGESPEILSPIVLNGHRGGFFAMRVKDSITVSSGSNFSIDISGKGFAGGHANNLPGQGALGYDNVNNINPNFNGGGGFNGDLPGGGGHGGVGGQGNGVSNGGLVVGDSYGCSDPAQDVSLKCLIGKMFFGGGGGSTNFIGTSGGGILQAFIHKINIPSGVFDLVSDGKTTNETDFSAATGAGGSILLQTHQIEITDASSANRLNLKARGGNITNYSSNQSGTGGGGRTHLKVDDTCITSIANTISQINSGGYVSGRAPSSSDGASGTTHIEGSCPP